MNKATIEIIDELNDDLAYHGWLVQCVNEVNEEDNTSFTWEEILEELLLNDVEIGFTEKGSPDYVAFIAWKGTVNERVKRAVKSVAQTPEDDKWLAYWLCLRRNIDRYE